MLNVEVDSMPNPIDYEGFGVGVKTSLSASYFDDYERLIGLSAENYLINRKEFIRSYLGNLDGKVKDRVCKVVTDIIKCASE